MLGNFFKKKTPETPKYTNIDIDGETFLNAELNIESDYVPRHIKIKVFLSINGFRESEISIKSRNPLTISGFCNSYADVVLQRGKVRLEKEIELTSKYYDPDIYKQVTQLISEFKEKEALYHKLDEYRQVINTELKSEKEKSS